MSVRSELETLIGALRFFTRLPIPGKLGLESFALERAIRYFAFSGLVVGGLAGLVFLMTSFFWPKTLAVLAALACAILLTGALHEDGWSDMADGFGGGWTRERVLEIMKDSRLGSFGAVALVMMLLVRFFALVEINDALLPIVLVAAHAVSRLCSTFVLAALEYARPEGKAKAFGNRLGVGELVFASLCALLPVVFLPPLPALFGLVLAGLATLWLARMFKRRIGGYTGDCLGGVQQLAEVAFYGGLLVRLG